MMVRLVQSGSLNRHVDDSIPLTWGKRWEALRVGLPLIVFSCVVYLPTLAVMALLEHSWEPIQRAMIPILCLPPFLLLVCEFSIRVQHKFKRVLELRDHRVAFQAGRHKNWAKWRDVKAVRFEPIPETTEHCVTLVETKSRKGKTGPRWALVLPWNEVKSVLVPELNRRMSENRSDFEIEFRERRTEVQAKPRLPMLWFFALGMFFLVHGMPFLGLGLIGLSESTEERREKRERREERGDNKFKLSHEAEKRLERFLVEHVRNLKRLNELYLWIGGTLTAVGVLLVGFDFRRLEKARNAASQRKSGLGISPKPGACEVDLDASTH